VALCVSLINETHYVQHIYVPLRRTA